MMKQTLVKIVNFDSHCWQPDNQPDTIRHMKLGETEKGDVGYLKIKTIRCEKKMVQTERVVALRELN